MATKTTNDAWLYCLRATWKGTSFWLIGLIAVPAYAQAGGVQAKVPFNFVISGKTLPAGEYTMIAGSHQVNIEDDHGKIVAMVLANDISGRAPGKNGQIIFHCYHNRCFLAEVWSPTQENGRVAHVAS